MSLGITKGYLLNKYLLWIETIRNTKEAFEILSGLTGVYDLIRRLKVDRENTGTTPDKCVNVYK